MQAFAQTVSGKVADANGEAIPGASVLVKGTTTGTMTDLDGAYQLAAGSNATLVFSCIGYQTQEVAVAGKGVINVVLTEDSTLLEETVVVAYGTAKRKDLTGSISTVDGSNIAVQAQGSVTRALEGQVAGLQTSSNDGQPGWDMGIRVRGMGTANVNYSNALVIIDGAPANDPGNASAVTGTNPLSAINSKDIESITVLKDAASTALYGSRGANGVVLITTKSGKAGKTRISFEARMGVNTVGANGYYDKIGDKGTYEIYETMWQAIYNDQYYGKAGNTMVGNKSAAAQFASEHLFNYNGSTSAFSRNGLGNKLNYTVPGMTFTKTNPGKSDESATLGGSFLVGTDGKFNPAAQLLYTPVSYQEALITPRFRQEYNISASGATDKVDYHMSVGYLSDPSYVSTSKFERLTARANVNAQVTSWLKAGAKFGYTHRTTNSAEYRWAGRNSGTVGENPFYFTTFTTALDNVWAVDAAGKFILDADGNKMFSADGSNSTITKSAHTYSPVGPTSAASSFNVPLYMQQSLNSQVLNDLDMKGYLRATFLKHFTAEVNVSYDITYGPQTRFYNVQSAGDRMGNKSTGSHIQKIDRTWATLNTQQLINYNQDFGKHHVDAMIGHEYNQFDSDGMQYGSSYSLLDDFMGYVNFLGTDTNKYISGAYGGTNLEKTAMESYIGRANYIYDDKYYVSASIRRDGSSKFKTEENRWGTFWSVGGGWRISSEPWMEGAKGWLDNLKIRASYGVIGNQNGIPKYSGYQTWSYSAAAWKQNGAKVYPDGTKLAMGTLVNDALTWEKVNTADAGVDFTLFGGKLAGSFDWFNKQTNNSIFGQTVSYLASGQTSLTQNNIGIRSTGIEIDLSYQPVKTKDWDVILSTNGTHYTTTLTSVPVGYGSEALGGCNLEGPTAWTVAGTGTDADMCYLRGVGKDYYNLYMMKYAGGAGN
ncbi:MAG: SusC/RagA family TonB-linked outer membrane protein [Bacteroidales bacterium]|nr:SusC/RagA family TonB-linked outer membrane protein [Bacteroidales bacterium]